MINHRLFAGALLAATAITAAAPAAAQRVDRIVVFGDSYADDNNAVQLLVSNPATPAALRAQLLQTYPTGRFSGGTNYIDTLAQLLAVPVENFAIGGARTGNLNQTPGLPGFTFEVTTFLAGGTTAPFQLSNPALDESDLVAVSIGGNDARAFAGTVAQAPAAATAAAAAATTDLNRLIAAGARNLSFVAGNTAILPEIAGNTAAQAVRNAFSTTFNTAMQNVLAGYAANGVIVNYTDLTLIGNQISANPGLYGLTSAGACNLGAACITDPAAANRFLFYVDNLHLSSAGFAILGRYVDRQMTAPLTLQAPTDTALDTALQFGRTLTTRMDLGSPRDGDMPEGLAIYAVGDSNSRTIRASQRNDQFKVTTVGLTGGVEYGFGSGLVGAALNVSRPKANFGNDKARDEVKSIQGGVYGGIGIAGGFVQGHAAIGRDRHDITREGVVSQLDASPRGRHASAGVKAGYLMPVSNFRVGPVVALDYARARVNSYTENGDPVLTLNVNRESVSALRGSIGAELRGDFAGNGVQVRPFAAALIEKDFRGDGRTFDYAQTSAPGIVNHYTVEDISKKAYGRLQAGLSAAILSGVSLNATVAGTVRKKQGNETSAQVGLRAAF
jgi:outer membrane autotransporter protein